MTQTQACRISATVLSAVGYKSLLFLDFQAYKRSNLQKNLDLENIRSIWPLTLEVPMRTPLRVTSQIWRDKLNLYLN